VNIVTHIQPHGDELCAIALIKAFGGFEQKAAKIITVGSDEEAKLHMHEDNIIVGIGGGRFDEHGKNNQECAATLVARQLRVDELKFFRLLEEVRQCDLTAKSRGQQLPEVIKALYDHKNENDVITWALRGYGALIKVIDDGTLDHEHNTEIVEEASIAVLERYKDRNQHAVKQAWKRCEAIVNNRRGALTEISVITDLIARDGIDGEALKWASDGIEALFLQQLDFQEALLTIEKRGRRFEAPLFQRGSDGLPRISKTLRCVGVFGENRAFSRAFRFRDQYDILVLRNPSGHVQVFSNAKTVPEGSMQICFQALAYAEARKRGSLADVSEFVGLDRTDHWYIHASAVILNGSKSHTGIEATRLTDKELIGIVSSSFDRNLDERWLKRQVYRTVVTDGTLHNGLPLDNVKVTA